MNRPNMLAKSGFHRWSNPERLMNTREVVMHVEQRDHRDVVVKFLAEGVRQTGEASHVHPHIEVLALK